MVTSDFSYGGLLFARWTTLEPAIPAGAILPGLPFGPTEDRQFISSTPLRLLSAAAVKSYFGPHGVAPFVTLRKVTSRDNEAVS